MSEEQIRLSKSGWTASEVSIKGVTLTYEGIAHRPSQRIIRYDTGDIGYDWPEIVPESVKVKIQNILEAELLILFLSGELQDDE